MAVSSEYLDRIGFATIRREPGDTSDEAMDQLLSDLIEQARADMTMKGLPKDLAADETNASVRGCISSYVRWRMAYANNDAVANLDEYQLQLDELRKSTWSDGTASSI